MTARKKFKNKIRAHQAKMGASYCVAQRVIARSISQPPEPFGTWLLTQLDREDVVGDLANDAQRDAQFPLGSVRDVIDYLAGKGSHIRDALAESIIEWRALRRGGVAGSQARARAKSSVPSVPCLGQRYRREDGSVIAVDSVNVDDDGKLLWVSTSDGGCVWASAWPIFVKTSQALTT